MTPSRAPGVEQSRVAYLIDRGGIITPTGVEHNSLAFTDWLCRSSIRLEPAALNRCGLDPRARPTTEHSDQSSRVADMRSYTCAEATNLVENRRSTQVANA